MSFFSSLQQYVSSGVASLSLSPKRFSLGREDSAPEEANSPRRRTLPSPTASPLPAPLTPPSPQAELRRRSRQSWVDAEQLTQRLGNLRD
ncbi:hypothetical protein J437_LFUL017880 [Ladona fulva]|uniref:Uncharacterized protein n=1 Tax=Ladona fulva TaxID=123851 RepID=A0A8K0PAD8_LADFU|nr:hypothetical protein J437_LFUL017880 [Ladona fulva]